MKKMLSMMLIMASLLCNFSCSSDDEEDEKIRVPSSCQLKVGEKFNLGYQGNWVSKNPFSATVDFNGIVSAVRQGSAIVQIKEKKLTCNITVSPSYTLYTEPITQWGLSRSSIINKKGTPDSSSSTVIGYKNSSTIVPLEMYLFEDDKLSSSAVVVKTTYTSELIEHLSQRFMPATVDMDNYRLYFLDAETLSESKNVVVADLYNTSHWLVMYMQKPDTKSIVDEKALFNSFSSLLNSNELLNL